MARNKEDLIIIVTNSNFPSGGASANFLRLLYKGINYNNKEVFVILQKGYKYGNLTIDFKELLDYKVYQCGFILRPEHYLLKFLDNIFGLILPVFKIISIVMKRQNIQVLVYNNTAYQVVPLLIICRLLGVNITNIVTEWYEKDSIIDGLTGYFRWYDFQFRMKYINLFFNKMIVFSQYINNYYLNNNFKGDILLIPNLVDIDEFNQEKAIKQDKSSSTIIGYCGTPNNKDGIDDLLKAFALLIKKRKDTKLLILGDSPGNISLLPRLRNLARALMIENSVIFKGLVPHDEISSLLQDCDILVLARPAGRFAEAGFPIKLGEYLSTKKPVVITGIGDIPRYFSNKVNAMIAEPNNPNMFFESILFLLQNNKLANDIGLNGYRWAVEKLEYKKVSKKIINFLKIDFYNNVDNS